MDAQLPRRLAYRLREAGHDALHTLDLPAGNRTTDIEITAVSEREGRVVVTKDADFVSSFWILGRPRKLLLVSVGNTTNAELEDLFVPRVSRFAATFSEYDFVEPTRAALIAHA